MGSRKNQQTSPTGDDEKGSRQTLPRLSGSDDPPEGDVETRGRELLKSLDNYSDTREFIAYLAEQGSEWAGIPTPVSGEKLTIAKGYPFAEAFASVDMLSKDDPYMPREGETHSLFWSTRLRATVVIFRNTEGKVVQWGTIKQTNPAAILLTTLGCSVAWSIEAEAQALQTLATLVGHVAFKHYLLTGTFLETSKRSGTTYLFRKLRPTVAMSTATGTVLILTCLCLHPVAYYEGSWAGALTPTDDVIAHLMLMRGDEHMFWKRARQHGAGRPEAGLHV